MDINNLLRDQTQSQIPFPLAGRSQSQKMDASMNCYQADYISGEKEKTRLQAQLPAKAFSLPTAISLTRILP